MRAEHAAASALIWPTAPPKKAPRNFLCLQSKLNLFIALFLAKRALTKICGCSGRPSHFDWRLIAALWLRMGARETSKKMISFRWMKSYGVLVWLVGRWVDFWRFDIINRSMWIPIHVIPLIISGINLIF
jgi:hypothetical protein